MRIGDKSELSMFEKFETHLLLDPGIDQHSVGLENNTGSDFFL